MQRLLDQQIFKWLNDLKIPVSFNYLKKELRSHPDYPSLSSITDTLDQLGIENAALVVDTERMNELPVPFLAHTNKSGGEYVIVQKASTFINTESSDYKSWNGVVVLAEKPDVFSNKENEEWLNKEKRNRYSMASVIALVIAFSSIIVVTQFSWILLGLVLSGLAGLFVAILIVQHELGYSNELTKQLCSINKNTDCDALLKSKGSKLIKGFDWADAGIIYFSASLILLLTYSFTNSITNLFSILPILAFGSVPFTFFSIYYQKQVIKKWCTLCLLTIGVLWIQVGLLLPFLFSLDFNIITGRSIVLTTFTLFFVSGLWFLLLKPLLKNEKELTDKNFSLMRIKSNVNVFKALLIQQRKVDVEPLEGDLQMGDSNAHIQIIVACNTFCNPCAIAHNILDKILDTHSDEVGITVRWYVLADKKDDKRTIAAEYMLQHLLEVFRKIDTLERSRYTRKMLHEWFESMDLEIFSKKYTTRDYTYVTNALRYQEEWCKRSNIESTPTIFINGFELPRQYTRNDLPEMITRLIEKGPEDKLFIA